MQESTKKIINTACNGALAGGVSAFTGQATDSLLNNATTNLIGTNNIAEMNETFGVAFHTLKKATEGGVSSGASKLVTNLYENWQETDTEKKRLLKKLLKNLYKRDLSEPLLVEVLPFSKN